VKIILFIFSILTFFQIPDLAFADSKVDGAELECSAEYRFDGKKLVLTENEQRETLKPEQFKILREGEIETPFHNGYHDNKKRALYVSAGYALPLYSSYTKFDTGTGWLSFWQPICPKNMTITEQGLIFTKNEVSCSRCGAHLSDVLNDGPPPTGNRLCMNSVSLKFIPK